MRSILANHAGTPCAWNLVWSRSALTEVTLQPPLPLNGARNSSWLIGCGPQLSGSKTRPRRSRWSCERAHVLEAAGVSQRGKTA
jgi:hypothetical protein